MKPLGPNKLFQTAYITTTHSIVLEQNEKISLEEVLDPKYWQHHTKIIRPGDKIEVRTEGNLFYADLFVMDVGHLAIKVRLLFAKSLQNTEESLNAIKIRKGADAPEIPDTPGYTVNWVSPPKKWGVKREGQEGWVKTGFAEKEDAQLWAAQDMKSMAV